MARLSNKEIRKSTKATILGLTTNGIVFAAALYYYLNAKILGVSDDILLFEIFVIISASYFIVVFVSTGAYLLLDRYGNGFIGRDGKRKYISENVAFRWFILREVVGD